MYDIIRAFQFKEDSPMANKPSPNSLIHCAECGEDYSATYKRCPFCGAKNTPAQSDPDRPAPPADLDDTYVFDGQDLFDDIDEGEGAAPRSRGGKRLAEKPLSNPFANADINWPRMITFICSLVIIVAAMVIVFTWIYPQLRDNKDPSAEGSGSPSFNVTDPGTDITPSPDPGTSDPGTEATNPPGEITPSIPPTASSGLKGFTTNTSGKDTDGFTLQAGKSWQLKLTFDPAGWNGEVTYSISDADAKYATVTPNGLVTNVYQGSGLHRVILTITAGDITLEMPVFCVGAADADPPATETSTAGDPSPSQTPSGSDGITVGAKGKVVNAPKGVFVRSTPSTSGDNRIASLKEGDPITVLEAVGDGWYKISFAGTGGPTEGYLMGECISTN